MTVRALWPDFRERVGRAIRGTSLAGTATAAGLPRNAVRDVIRGHEPRLSRVAAVAQALGFALELSPKEPRSDPSTGEVTLTAEQYRRLREGVAVLGGLGAPPPDHPKKPRAS